MTDKFREFWCHDSELTVMVLTSQDSTASWFVGVEIHYAFVDWLGRPASWQAGNEYHHSALLVTAGNEYLLPVIASPVKIEVNFACSDQIYAKLDQLLGIAPVKLDHFTGRPWTEKTAVVTGCAQGMCIVAAT